MAKKRGLVEKMSAKSFIHFFLFLKKIRNAENGSVIENQVKFSNTQSFCIHADKKCIDLTFHEKYIQCLCKQSILEASIFTYNDFHIFIHLYKLFSFSSYTVCMINRIFLIYEYNDDEYWSKVDIWYLFLSIRSKYCSFCIHHQMESEASHLSIKQSYRLFHTSEEHRFSVCNFWHTIFSPLSDPSRLHLATPFVILGCVHKKYGKNWWRIIKWHCKNNHFDFPYPTLQAFFCLKAIKI